MRRERIARLAGRDHHPRLLRRGKVGDDPQPGAKTLLVGVRLIADQARAAVDRGIAAGCRDRDAQPVAQPRDALEDRMRKLGDMRPAPLPVRHLVCRLLLEKKKKNKTKMTDRLIVAPSSFFDALAAAFTCLLLRYIRARLVEF